MTLIQTNQVTLVAILIREAATITKLSASKIHKFESLNKSDRPIMRARAAIMCFLREQVGMKPRDICKLFDCNEDIVYKNTRNSCLKRETDEFKLVYAHLEKTTYR